MLPEGDLPLRIVDHAAFIDFLGPQDEPWLGVLLDEMQRFEGRPRRALCERLAEPLSCDAPLFKRRAASRVLLRLWGRAPVQAAACRARRAALFEAAAARPDAHADVLAERAAAEGLTPEALLAALFSDLGPERAIAAPVERPSAHEVALRTNLAIAQAVLMRAAIVSIKLEGQVRPLVRLAKLHGLLCTLKEPLPGAPPVLEISGPLALFRHTLVYGRALGALLSPLMWCARWTLETRASLRGRLCDVRLDKGAPLHPGRAPAVCDSQLEARFLRDVSLLTTEWDVLREPEPLAVDGTLIFPDFLLRHRLVPTRRALVEVVGFWTPDYLATKLGRLRAARVDALVLCLDEDRACGAADVPADAAIVRFRRRIDAAEVLAHVERLTAVPQGAAGRHAL